MRLERAHCKKTANGKIGIRVLYQPLRLLKGIHCQLRTREHLLINQCEPGTQSHPTQRPSFAITTAVPLARTKRWLLRPSLMIELGKNSTYADKREQLSAGCKR